MPRVCAREGCGKRLIRKDGTPDYRRHFCETGCKNADKRERMQAKRQQAQTSSCPLCGHKTQRLAQNTCVPRHKAN